MNQIEIYNHLDGNNLCNLFANTIVEKLKENNPNVMVEISVINVRNFFIVRGKTDSDTVLNLTDVISKKLESLKPESSKLLKIIDVILYNTSFDDNTLNVTETYVKNNRHKFYQKFVNQNSKDGLYFNIKVDELHSIILFDCDKEDISKVKNVLLSEFPSFDVIKSDFSSDTYFSDSIYGLNVNSEKSYKVLSQFISEHLFHLGLSNEVSINIFSKSKLSEIDNLNCEIKISSDKNMVKSEWLESLILDVFPINLSDIIKEFNLNGYNFESTILDSENKPYSKLNKVSEFILV